MIQIQLLNNLKYYLHNLMIIIHIHKFNQLMKIMITTY